MSTDSHRDSAKVEAEALMSEHEGPLLRYAVRILGDNAMAQDTVEEVFVQFFQKQDWLVGMERSEISPALYREVHKAAARRICRREKTGGKAAQGCGERAMEVVRRLTLDEQQLVILKIFEAKSNFEISRITGINEVRVAALLSSYIMKVAVELKKAGLL